MAFRSYVEPYLKLIYMAMANNPPAAPKRPRRPTQGENMQLTESALKRGLDTLLFVEEGAGVPARNVKAEVLDHLGVPHSIARIKLRIPWKRLASQWRERTPCFAASLAAMKKRWARARGDRRVYSAYLEHRAKDIEDISRSHFITT